MAEKDFLLSDFAKHARVLFDCMQSATDKSPAAFDRKAARDAIKAMGDMLGPGEAQDTDPALAEQERKLKTSSPTQETAKDRALYNTEYSVAAIFGGGKHDSEGASVGAPQISDIFHASPKLAEG